MNSVTVIIPTREHPETLLATLRTVIQQDYDRLEIIVSDNFSNDSTEDVVRSFTDRRVKYINTGKRLSMSENWDFALSHATGDWISVLGDDDGTSQCCVC
jgi:glycosyltransferase involved in cell wall biosynthesis